MWEDLLLVHRLRRGDREAMGRIYEKYKADLLTVGACMLGHLGPAEDCLQDVFVTLAESVQQLRLHKSLRGYLVTCMANRARDQMRRKRRGVGLEAAGEAAGTGDPSRELTEREESEKWCARLGALPEDQREVITLHLHGRLKFREIARQQEVSLNTVQSRYRYGLAKLRSMAEEGAES